MFALNMRSTRLTIIICLLVFCVVQIKSEKNAKNKYSKEANTVRFTTEKYDPDVRKLNKPFRIAKLNLVWSKAQHVSKKIVHLKNYKL